MIARDPEWEHIAVAVTFEAGNKHLIHFICDGQVVSEANREGIASNIAELLSSSATFHVGPPNVQSFPTLLQGFRAEPGFNVFGKDFEPSLLLADMCVAVCPEGAMKLSDSSCDCAPGLFQVWYIRGLFIKQQGLIQSLEVTAYTNAGQPVEHVVESGEVYMDFGTAMETSVVTVSAVGCAGSNTQIMMRVVSLEGKLLDVPEYQVVPIQEWTTYLFHRRVNHYSDPTVACVSCVNSVGSSVPREDILACKCEGSVDTPLGVCGDFLARLSELEFSLEEGAHAPGALLYLIESSELRHNEIRYSVGSSEIETTCSSMMYTNSLDVISRRETSVVYALICNV